MRELFPEFNRPTSQELKKHWDEGVFIFDANVLLNLYRFPVSVRKKLMETLKKINDRIWIPHQVATEFYRNRLEVIYGEERCYDEIINFLTSNEKTLRAKLEQHSRHPFVRHKRLTKSITDAYNRAIRRVEELQQKHPKWEQKDPIEAELNTIFKGKVGPAYDVSTLNKIYDEGAARYEKEIPPGFEDKQKDKEDKTGTRKYGDLILWMQIMEKAKELKKPIFFITDDQKQDWWWELSGKTIGARHELVREIRNQAGVAFYMFQSDRFMEFAKETLKITFANEDIAEVKKLREEAKGKDKLVETAESVASPIKPLAAPSGAIVNPPATSTDSSVVTSAEQTGKSTPEKAI